jgi:hypothetical protein
MHLDPGRRDKMVRDSLREETAIVCHSTLGTKSQAVCRGFYERHETLPLKLARAMGAIEFQ